jgi:predicted deacylase
MLLRLAFLIVGVGCFAATAFGQRASFTLGTATAASGQSATGFLHVPAGVDAATDIPVIVVNGAKSGPVLALVSGAHGTEYASIIALEKLIPALDPAELSGTVVLLPLVNIPDRQEEHEPLLPGQA